jgi:DNA-binding transcriptional LysR family regulator
MLDRVSIDQLRAFIAAADEGSFSAAARKLDRAQSVVSGLVGGLEREIGISLFDRSGHFPKLTSQGRAILADARSIAAGLELMKSRAKGMASGLEHELSLVVSILLPISVVSDAAKDFRQKFPGTPMRLYVDALGAAYQRLTDKNVALGILAPPIAPMPAFTFERMTAVSVIRVAAKEHPLAAFKGSIPRSELANHIQLTFADRSSVPRERNTPPLSPSIWRLTDVFAKHAFLLRGVGWGGMPYHVVKEDIATGRLVELRIEDEPPTGTLVSLSAVYPTAAPPGFAGRWFIDRLKTGCETFEGLLPRSISKPVAGKKSTSSNVRR